ncbi:MAG: hypothetical protein OXL33_08455 [Chloroflexota bacterium]|nr:hypothetical protein [Chloroflexota bacterium]
MAQCAAAALLNLVAKMAVPDDDGHFITSVLAIRVDEVLDLLPGSDAPIWFPLGPDVALILHGEERWSPILGQALHGPDLGAVQAVGPSRRIRARCPTVEPIEVPTDAYNGTMVIGERKLFSRSRPARWRIWP